MIRVTYISTARPDLQDQDIEAILAASRRNNRAAGLTGMLLYDGKRFLQSIEGARDIVMATLERIRADPRHRAFVELARTEITAHAFSEWDMAWQRLTAAAGGASLADAVERMVRQVPDVSTRILFSSFSKIDRSAA